MTLLEARAGVQKLQRDDRLAQVKWPRVTVARKPLSSAKQEKLNENQTTPPLQKTGFANLSIQQQVQRTAKCYSLQFEAPASKSVFECAFPFVRKPCGGNARWEKKKKNLQTSIWRKQSTKCHSQPRLAFLLPTSSHILIISSLKPTWIRGWHTSDGRRPSADIMTESRSGTLLDICQLDLQEMNSSRRLWHGAADVSPPCDCCRPSVLWLRSYQFWKLSLTSSPPRCLNYSLKQDQSTKIIFSTGRMRIKDTEWIQLGAIRDINVFPRGVRNQEWWPWCCWMNRKKKTTTTQNTHKNARLELVIGGDQHDFVRLAGALVARGYFSVHAGLDHLLCGLHGVLLVGRREVVDGILDHVSWVDGLLQAAGDAVHGREVLCRRSTGTRRWLNIVDAII